MTDLVDLLSTMRTVTVFNGGQDLASAMATDDESSMTSAESKADRARILATLTDREIGFRDESLAMSGAMAVDPPSNPALDLAADYAAGNSSRKAKSAALHNSTAPTLVWHLHMKAARANSATKIKN